MKHIGLFAGIGGFEYAAHCVGWETITWCEINEFCQRVLKYHFPNATAHSDIKTTDFTVYRGKCDIVTGGFPCQPYSLAGKRKGTEDERHLWPEMLRAIREIQPSWVVGENVLGIVNWDGGLVFEQVQVDLEAEGYEVQAFVLPACAVNAPHRRDRVWFVAYSDKCAKGPSRTSGGATGKGSNNDDEQKERGEPPKQHIGCSDVSGAYPDTNHVGCRRGWEKFPTQPPLCGGNDGFPNRLVGITVSKHRNESIKAFGNAIVPQVAMQIFKAINELLKQT